MKSKVHDQPSYDGVRQLCTKRVFAALEWFEKIDGVINSILGRYELFVTVPQSLQFRMALKDMVTYSK